MPPTHLAAHTDTLVANCAAKTVQRNLYIDGAAPLACNFTRTAAAVFR